MNKICSNCRYKNDCQLSLTIKLDRCVYKHEAELARSINNIDSIINDVRKNDIEFYKEIKGIFKAGD